MGIDVQALDSVYGQPAASVDVRLDRADDGQWVIVSRSETDHEGHVKEWRDHKLDRGLYRIVFASDRYFAGLGLSAAYPEIVVVFRMIDEMSTYQIKVLLSPHSYSAYFGSFN